jgi:hypothetical protein
MKVLKLMCAAVPMFLLAACDVMDIADLASNKSGAAQNQAEPAIGHDQMVGVPAGTELTLALDKMLSSRTSHAGDAFSATVIEPIVLDGREVIPAGSTIEGRVTEATSARQGARKATLAVSIGALRFATGYQTDIVGRLQEVRASRKTENAAVVEWSATGGWLRERIMGKDTREMVIGAIVGGRVGTLAMMNKSGTQVIIPVDTPFGFKLEEAIQVPQTPSST